jgi:hypothetical protein
VISDGRSLAQSIREPIGEWLPALSTDDAEFRRFLTAMDWLD